MKRLIVFLVLLLFVIGVQAENDGVPDESPVGADGIDYSDEALYNTADFYKTSDPLQWDYSQVEWWQVEQYRPEVFSMPAIYEKQDFYDNLKWSTYRHLEYEHVDYTKIDHSQIYASKFVQDFGCTDCSFLGDEGLQYAPGKEGQPTKITAATGDFITIPGEYPAGTRFSQNRAGNIEVTIPGGEALFVHPDNPDQFSFGGARFYDDEPAYLLIAGQKILVKKEVFVRGDMLFVPNDRWHHTVGGFELDNLEHLDEPLPVYLDGEKHEGTYMSLDLNKGIFHMRANGITVVPDEPFVQPSQVWDERWERFVSYTARFELEDFLDQEPHVSLQAGTEDTKPVLTVLEGNVDFRLGAQRFNAGPSGTSWSVTHSKHIMPFDVNMWQEILLETEENEEEYYVRAGKGGGFLRHAFKGKRSRTRTIK